MARIVVTGVFTTEWDTDSYREQWDEPDMTDEDILKECLASVEQEWCSYAVDPDTVSVQGELIA